MEVIIKDDVEVSKKGKITMDLEVKSIWEVIIYFFLFLLNLNSNSVENETSLPGSADHKISW